MATVMPAVPQISLQNVQKTYPNGTVALHDVTLVIPKQDFVFLVGPSGAGKSTLVRLLIREEKVTGGKIQVEGQDLSRLKRRHLPFLRRKIGMVFQDFKLLPNLTVFQNVAFALRVTASPSPSSTPSPSPSATVTPTPTPVQSQSASATAP